MIIVLGLLSLLAAISMGITGVVTDAPFLFGVPVGALAMIGLGMLATATVSLARPTPNPSPTEPPSRSRPSWRDRIESRYPRRKQQAPTPPPPPDFPVP